MNGSGLISQGDEFREALERHAPRYGLRLDAKEADALSSYYRQVMAWNTRLHLVAPCSPPEFATRHVLESLAALPFLTRGARVADVGSGAGLPIIPCLVMREDLSATLIEASPKKAVFLREAIYGAGARDRAQVIAERFEKRDAPEAEFVTCRALERFTEMFPRLVAWAPRGSTLLLFAGPSLEEEIEKGALDYRKLRLPESERRFLFIIRKEPEA